MTIRCIIIIRRIWGIHFQRFPCPPIWKIYVLVPVASSVCHLQFYICFTAQKRPKWRMSRAHRHRDIQQSSFSNLSVTSPTSQLILQPFRRFTYVAAHSPTLPLLHLRHNSFYNPPFASPTSQALHLNHLASRPWHILVFNVQFKVWYERDLVLKAVHFRLLIAVLSWWPVCWFNNTATKTIQRI